MSETPFPPAPPLFVERWFNSPHDITLESLRGKVVVVEAFQMLCPAVCRTVSRRHSEYRLRLVQRAWWCWGFIQYLNITRR